ncbi:S1C family serine protease [Coprococcus sp. AF21-14LB]|uniref:S1C family serine protease n=1 Tax=Coprococcus sp. AF21-14LB TaxID=2292231 RepID=UPI000E529463|nr:trypsin-like peptidase domain-containing protein [Coprococcus sp. AF21-14LB]RGS82369.1 PDZ domain-containing protein [Coprococcus sp. AF21-14LB]
MSNEYSYQIPNDGDQNYTESNQEPENRRPKKKGRKAVAVVCAGMVFGLVASVTFQASNYMVERVLGKSERTTSTTKNTSSSSTNVNSTKLTQTKSTVTSDISEIVENAMPSVVSITNISVQQVQSFFQGTQEYESQSSGSGIIIGKNDSELLVVSNNHVVSGSDTLTVTFINNTSVEAQIKGTDPDKDLAVVAVPLDKIDEDTMSQIAVATLGDSSELKVGEPVIAIGNALGYGQSVTNGIVSAKDRTLSSSNPEGETEENSVKYIQTNAAINPGNSGGALLNMNGEVIGINTAKVADSAVEGMGYAIPVSDVSDIIEDLMNRTTRTKVNEGEQGQLGITGFDVAEENAAMYGMPKGVYISKVAGGSGAEKAGLTKGSIIVEFDGTAIDSMATLQERLQYYKAGETVSVTVRVPSATGEYTENTVDVTLGERTTAK